MKCHVDLVLVNLTQTMSLEYEDLDHACAGLDSDDEEELFDLD